MTSNPGMPGPVSGSGPGGAALRRWPAQEEGHPSRAKDEDQGGSEHWHKDDDGAEKPRVYTVNDESRYLVVRNVPALGCTDDLVKLLALHGPIQEYRMLDEDDAAGPYTDTVWVQFQHTSNATFARRKLHQHVFFGSPLQVSYAPADETPADTLAKLEERAATCCKRVARLASEGASVHVATSATMSPITAPSSTLTLCGGRSSRGRERESVPPPWQRGAGAGTTTRPRTSNLEHVGQQGRPGRPQPKRQKHS